MKKNQDQPADAAELRGRAEARLSEKQKSQRSEAGDQRTAEDTARLVHKLQVHQIELEMQNEELKQARAKADELLAHYTDLYDFAPAGYLTLDREGAIRLVNLPSVQMLGIERSRLVKRRFGQFVAESDRRAFSDFLQKVFASEAKERCEVTLPREGLQPLVVQIKGTRSADGQECRAMLLDITERRAAEATTRQALAKVEASRKVLLNVVEDQKRTEAALRENEIRYRTLVENAPVAVFVNRADRIVLANEACLRLFGATAPEQLLGKSPV
jgi:PAS domain S-box-containing protein